MHAIDDGRPFRRLDAGTVLVMLGAMLMQPVAPASAQAGIERDAATAKAEVLALDTRRARALVDSDAALLDRITAPDYTHVETTGEARTKAGFLDMVRSGDVRFLTFDITGNEARLYGDVAVLTGVYTNQVETRDGVQPVKRARHQRVYVRGAGGWRVVAHQATAIP